METLLNKIKEFFTKPGLAGRLAVVAVIATSLAQYFTSINATWSLILLFIAAVLGAFGRALMKWTDTHVYTLGGVLAIAGALIGDALAANGADVSPIKALFGEHVFTVLRHAGEVLVIISRPLVLATNGLDTTKEDVARDKEILDGKRRIND